MTERSVFVLFVGSMSLDTMKYVLADGRMTLCSFQIQIIQAGQMP